MLALLSDLRIQVYLRGQRWRIEMSGLEHPLYTIIKQAPLFIRCRHSSLSHF